MRIKLPFYIALCLTILLLLPGCAAPEEAPVEEIATTPVIEEPAKPKIGSFVTVPAGEFTMGSNFRPTGYEEKPQLHEPEHTRDIPAFQIGTYEVTNGEYIRFELEGVHETEGNWKQFYNLGKEDYPVANVTWNDAQAYCEWIGGRLPTESEWEKAARGPEGFKYPWGNEFSPSKSNSNEAGYRNVVEVGQFGSGDISAYGAIDMLGNVQEWVSDRLRAYRKSPARRDPNFSRNFYSARGGSYAIRGRHIGLYVRGAYLKKGQYGTGFRCAKDAEETEQSVE